MLSEKWKWTKPRTKPRYPVRKDKDKTRQVVNSAKHEKRFATCACACSVEGKKSPASSSATQDKT